MAAPQVPGLEQGLGEVLSDYLGAALVDRYRLSPSAPLCTGAETPENGILCLQFLGPSGNPSVVEVR